MGFKFIYPLASFVRNKKTFATLIVIILLASAVLSNVKTVASLIEDPPITDIHSFPGQMVASAFSSNGTLFSGDNNYKLYRSNDNGTSFGLIYTFPMQSSSVGNSSGYVWTVFIDSRNYIFVSIPGTNRLYRSTTFGSTFTQVLNTNGTQNDGFYIALTEDSAGNLFTATYCNSLYPLKPSILKSTDGGESWTKIGEASTVHFHNII
jgi:hypothetical protein